MALVLIRVRNQSARERYRTGLSREQMCLRVAGYPKRRAAMSGLGLGRVKTIRWTRRNLGEMATRGHFDGLAAF